MVLKQCCLCPVSVSCLVLAVVWLFNVNTYSSPAESLCLGKKMHNPMFRSSISPFLSSPGSWVKVRLSARDQSMVGFFGKKSRSRGKLQDSRPSAIPCVQRGSLLLEIGGKLALQQCCMCLLVWDDGCHVGLERCCWVECTCSGTPIRFNFPMQSSWQRMMEKKLP